jgi:HPt (histidine-containing phosphotransfer) domain-containing protein
MDDYLAKPIRPGDVRKVIEHWSPQMSTTKPTESVPSVETTAPPPATSPPDAEPPVEMSRLINLVDGDIESLRELVELYFRQTSQQLVQLEAAARGNKADEVRHVAHSCAGASATLGMVRLVPLLRELEKQGAAGALTNAAQLCENAAREFKLIQNFLASQPSLAAVTAPKA